MTNKRVPLVLAALACAGAAANADDKKAGSDSSDSSSTSTTVVVRTTNKDGVEQKQEYKKVVKDGVVVEEHGDPRLLDGSDARAPIDPKEEVDRLMKKGAIDLDELKRR